MNTVNCDTWGARMSDTATAQAVRAISATRYWLEKNYPAPTHDFDLLSHSPTLNGFVVTTDSTLSLIISDTTSSQPNNWFLQVSTGLGVDVPNVQGSLEWTNDRNRASATSRYYCAVAAAQNMSAVICETVLWGDLFEMFLNGGVPALGGYLMGTVKTNLEGSELESSQLVAKFGGRNFTTNDLMTLFMASCGG